MKNNSLDEIVKCTIEISNPGSSDATFDTILMVVEPPDIDPNDETEYAPIKRTTAVRKAAELLDYGYSVDSEAYKAATIAFSQNPCPSEILFTVRGTVPQYGQDQPGEGDPINPGGNDNEQPNPPIQGDVAPGNPDDADDKDKDPGENPAGPDEGADGPDAPAQGDGPGDVNPDAPADQDNKDGQDDLDPDAQPGGVQNPDENAGDPGQVPDVAIYAALKDGIAAFNLDEEEDEEGDEPVVLVEWENIQDTLNRALSEASFYGIHLTSFRSPEDIQDAMQWAEANERMFFFEYTDYDAFPVQNTNYYRTVAMFSGLADEFAKDEQPEENKYAALAWMAKCFGYDPGSETWNLKTLSTIVPSALSSQQKNELTEKNINTFLRYAKVNSAMGGMTLAGEWIDVIRFRDWLKNEIQISVFNTLKTNRKVPFTDAGIALIETAVLGALGRGQNVGGIAPNEFDADDNYIPGFTLSVPNVSDLTEAERKSRVLKGVVWTARLAGAIHVVEVYGYMTF